VSDDRAFLQDILEHPEDDAPRLVYADWLEESGEPERAARAEFIRVQYALQRLPPGDARRPQLEERERDLRLAHEAEWVAPLRELGSVQAWEFRRGFVEKVALRVADFLGLAERLFAAAPVRELRLDFDSMGYALTSQRRLELVRRTVRHKRDRGGWSGWKSTAPAPAPWSAGRPSRWPGRTSWAGSAR
jgi:uncharacterized protein (TIGR02996 family)